MSTSEPKDNTTVVLRVSAVGRDDLARFVDSIQAGKPLTTGIQTASAERMTFGTLASAEVNAGTMAFRSEPSKTTESPAIAYAGNDDEILLASLPRLPGKTPYIG